MNRPSVRLLIFAGIHVGSCAVGFAASQWYVWIAVWMLQAVNFLTVVAVVHECTHQHYFSSRRANRITGTLMASLGLTCFEAYRAQHTLHHAHTCDVGDTEGEPYKFTARWQIAGAFLGGGLFYSLLLTGTGFAVAAGHSPTWLASDRQRRRIRINVAVLTIGLAAVVALVVLDVVSFRAVAFAWLVPAVVAMVGPVPFVLIPEHYDAPGPGPAVVNTRTCTSNPVLRFFYLNTNLHTAHHDRPAVVWQELPAHHRTIEDDIRPEWLFPSYWAFHRFMWTSTARRPTTAAHG